MDRTELYERVTEIIKGIGPDDDISVIAQDIVDYVIETVV